MTHPALRFMRQLLLAGALAAHPALAETCKYVDQDGRVTYANVVVKDAKKLSCLGPPPPPIASITTRSADSENFPKVDGETQKKRDNARRRILEEELAQEESLLAEAKQQLAQQEAVRLGDERNYQKYLDRVQPFKNAVALHEKNVAALRQELTNQR